MDQLLRTIRTFDGVLELAPAHGSTFPEIAWGDHFFYYAPNGQVPHREQPYATIVTKNYPDDTLCDLDRPGRWRLNIHVGRNVAAGLLGGDHEDPIADVDFTAVDTVLPHPLYGAQGWISIINPGEDSHVLAVELLRTAHAEARRRAGRRSVPRPLDR